MGQSNLTKLSPPIIIHHSLQFPQQEVIIVKQLLLIGILLSVLAACSQQGKSEGSVSGAPEPSGTPPAVEISDGEPSSEPPVTKEQEPAGQVEAADAAEKKVPASKDASTDKVDPAVNPPPPSAEEQWNPGDAIADAWVQNPESFLVAPFWEMEEQAFSLLQRAGRSDDSELMKVHLEEAARLFAELETMLESLSIEDSQVKTLQMLQLELLGSYRGTIERYGIDGSIETLAQLEAADRLFVSFIRKARDIVGAVGQRGSR